MDTWALPGVAPARPMTENSFNDRLAELTQQFSAIQELSQGDPVRAGQFLPRAITGLQLSLRALQTFAAGGARDGRGNALVTAIEITERKQAETHLALQYALGRILSEAKTLEEAAQPLLEILGEGLDWDLGELWSVDAGARAPRCAQLWARASIDVSSLRKISETRVFPSGAGLPWQDGSPLWIADMANDVNLAHEPEAEQLGQHAMFRLPIQVHGEVRALVRLFCSAVRQEDVAVVEFMQAIGLQVGQFLERQHNETRIRESEARKAAILEASLEAVITIDHEGNMVEFNSAAEAIFGYRRAETIGHKLLDLIVPPRMHAQVVSGIADYQATGSSAVLGKRFDASAMRADGSEFPVEIAVTPIAIGNPPLLTIFLSDATQRRNAEQEVRVYQERLRSLATDLLLAEEQERRRLAIDLHDGLSQTIALVQIKLSAVRLVADVKLARALDEIGELVEQANRAARSISFELSPPVLHDLGLEPALQWLVENIQARYGIEIVLEDDGKPKPADETTRVILFRSIRELLINAAKHAGARLVRLRLRREEDQVDAAVEDDGVGMETDLTEVKGFGLFSIHERLSHVGGSMHIESAPGQGRESVCAHRSRTSDRRKRW